MAITVSSFRERYPKEGGEGVHFDDVPDAVLEGYLARYSRRLSVEVYGEDWEDCVYLYTAHRAELYKRARKEGRGATGPLTSKTAQRTGTAYSAPTVYANEGHLTSTPFGMEILEIERGLLTLPGVL